MFALRTVNLAAGCAVKIAAACVCNSSLGHDVLRRGPWRGRHCLGGGAEAPHSCAGDVVRALPGQLRKRIGPPDVRLAACRQRGIETSLYLCLTQYTVVISPRDHNIAEVIPDRLRVRVDPPLDQAF